MATVPMDARKVARCRALAGEIADDVQSYIDAHTTVGVERTILRAYGADGVDDQGAPLVNTAVERYREAGLLGRGIALPLGRALLAGAANPQEAAERLAFGPELDRARGRTRTGRGPRGASAPHRGRPRPHRPRTRRRARRSGAASRRARRRSSTSSSPRATSTTTRCRPRRPPHAGADIVAVIRATAQSLLDYVPHGATTEGYGGTFATQENFRIIRRALDEASERVGRYIQQTNYSSGLCMAEIAWMAAVERLDMLLNDAMYGILFRDINMCRTFVDQYVSRRFIARAGIVINTGEDNYLTTADAVEKAHTVLASQFINEAFALRAGLREEQMGLGHAYEIDPWLEDSLSPRDRAGAARPADLRPAPHQVDAADQAQDGRHLLRPRARRDVRPRRRHDQAEHRAPRDVQRGDPQPAPHGPVPRAQGDALRLTAPASTSATRSSSSPTGSSARRAEQVLDEALAAPRGGASASRSGSAIARGAFADVKRTRTGGKGYAGVVPRSDDYVNPLLEALEAQATARSLPRRLAALDCQLDRWRARGRARCYRSVAPCIPRAPSEPLRAYGDREGDGMVQLSFVLELPPSARAREAAKRFAEMHGLARADRRDDGGVLGGHLVLRRLRPLAARGRRRRRSTSPEVRTEALSRDEIEQRISTRLGRKIVVVGACTGSDAHTVGIDAILNYKGYAGDKGLESYKGFEVYNLGAQVENETLAARARAVARRRDPRQPGDHAAKLPQGERPRARRAPRAAGMAAARSSCSSAARAWTTRSPSSSASTPGSARAPSRATSRRTSSSECAGGSTPRAPAP